MKGENKFILGKELFKLITVHLGSLIILWLVTGSFGESLLATGLILVYSYCCYVGVDVFFRKINK